MYNDNTFLNIIQYKICVLRHYTHPLMSSMLSAITQLSDLITLACIHHFNY